MGPSPPGDVAPQALNDRHGVHWERQVAALESLPQLLGDCRPRCSRAHGVDAALGTLGLCASPRSQLARRALRTLRSLLATAPAVLEERLEQVLPALLALAFPPTRRTAFLASEAGAALGAACSAARPTALLPALASALEAGGSLPARAWLATACRERLGPRGHTPNPALGARLARAGATLQADGRAEPGRQGRALLVALLAASPDQEQFLAWMKQANIKDAQVHGGHKGTERRWGGGNKEGKAGRGHAPTQLARTGGGCGCRRMWLPGPETRESRRLGARMLGPSPRGPSSSLVSSCDSAPTRR